MHKYKVTLESADATRSWGCIVHADTVEQAFTDAQTRYPDAVLDCAETVIDGEYACYEPDGSRSTSF